MNNWEHGESREEWESKGPHLGPLDILYGTLFQPQATFKQLRYKPPYLLAIAVFIVAGIVSAALTRQIGPILLSELESLPGFDQQLALDWAQFTGAASFLAFWFGLFNWLFITGLFHLIASFLGGQGSAGALFAFLGLAHLPSIFAAPLGALELNTGVPLLSSLGFALDIWRYYLYYRALRVTYDLSRGRTLAVLLAPVAIAIVAMVGLLVMFMGFFAVTSSF